jgi:hypothetical protein
MPLGVIVDIHLKNCARAGKLWLYKSVSSLPEQDRSGWLLLRTSRAAVCQSPYSKEGPSFPKNRARQPSIRLP